MLKNCFLTLCATLALFPVEAACQAPEPVDIHTVVSKFDAYMREAMKTSKVPGAAVAIVYRGEVVWLQGYGVRKLNEYAKVDADTVFEIASMSKPIASTIMASLTSNAGIRWDDKVHDYDPGFKLSNATATSNVTLRDLFSHRSGLPTGGGDILEDLGYTRPEVLEKMGLVPLAGELGKTYHYSNFGLTEAAIAVSKKVGKPWEKVAEEQLYAKLGMSSTSSRFSDYENNPNKAAIHFQACDAKDNCVFENRFTRDADPEAPAGGVSSNVHDLAKWLQLQLAGGSFNGKQIIERAALEETRKAVICKSVPVVEPGAPCPGDSFYGLGWGVGKTSWGATMDSHSGAFLLGTATAVYMLPEEQIGIIVLGNSAPVGLPEAAALTFLDYFHYGKAQKDWLKLIGPVFVAMRKEAQDSSPQYSTLKLPQPPKPAKTLTAYTGTYVSPYYGALEVKEEQGKLILRLPPRAAYYELEHWDGDTFIYYFATENSGVGRRGAKFSPTQVLIESLAIGNNGIFTKLDPVASVDGSPATPKPQ